MTRHTRHPARHVAHLPTLAGEIREDIEAADKHWQSAVHHAIRAGEGLIAAKAQLQHGEWLPWLKANFPGFSARSASNYMRIAQNSNAVADLPSVREAVALLTSPTKATDEDDEPTSRAESITEAAEKEGREVERQALAEGLNPHLAAAKGLFVTIEALRRLRGEALVSLADEAQASMPELSVAAGRLGHLLLAVTDDEALGSEALLDAEIEATERLREIIAAIEGKDERYPERES